MMNNIALVGCIFVYLGIIVLGASEHYSTPLENNLEKLKFFHLDSLICPVWFRFKKEYVWLLVVGRNTYIVILAHMTIFSNISGKNISTFCWILFIFRINICKELSSVCYIPLPTRTTSEEGSNTNYVRKSFWCWICAKIDVRNISVKRLICKIFLETAWRTSFYFGAHVTIDWHSLHNCMDHCGPHLLSSVQSPSRGIDSQHQLI